MNRHAWRGPAMGCPYNAVGMQRAFDSAIGLSSSSTSASWMLVFLMPADVRRSFKLPPEFVGVGENVSAPMDAFVLETRSPTKTHRFRRCPAQLFRRSPGRWPIHAARER